MHTTLTWFRERPLVPDAILAVLLAASGIVLSQLLPAGPWQPRTPSTLSVALSTLGCLSLVFRRRRPFLLLCALEAMQATLVLSTGAAEPLLGLAIVITLYTVAAHRGLALSLAALVIDVFVFLLLLVASGGTPPGQVLNAVFPVTVWVIGRSVRLRRAYLAELRDRAERLEAARESDTRAARAEERSRIARELHDVVAHHVSVMTVQAAAARRVLTSNPEGAAEALSAIESMGRTAMSEMRNIVGVLRTEGAGPAERGPQPGLQELPALVEQMREAGLSTQLWLEGERTPLPPGIDLAAYRLIQEALTNTLRHAGPAARAWVTVRHEPGEFTVHIEDDGLGAGGRSQRAEGRRSGHGLVGIRERVALYGGILRIGPRPGGGFEVRARFPLKD